MKHHFRQLIIDDWPEIDRSLWFRAGQSPQSIWDDINVASTWRDTSLHTVSVGYGIALGWLGETLRLDPETAPIDRWSNTILHEYVATLSDRLRPASARSYLLTLERAMAALHPEEDRSKFKRAIRSIKSKADQRGKRARLQQPVVLEAFGRRLMSEARQQAPNRISTAVLFRDGLQIALLAKRPLRRRNFSEITIGIHLVDEGDWILRFSPEETKNKKPLLFAIPEDLKNELQEYLDLYRPVLAAGRYTGQRLWLVRGGYPQKPHSLGLRITDLTRKEFGKHVNPHLFRDGAATSVAIDDPKNVRIVQHVLGHTFSTTQRHYNLAQSMDASRKVNQTLSKLNRKPRGRAAERRGRKKTTNERG